MWSRLGFWRRLKKLLLILGGFHNLYQTAKVLNYPSQYLIAVLPQSLARPDDADGQPDGQPDHGDDGEGEGQGDDQEPQTTAQLYKLKEKFKNNLGMAAHFYHQRGLQKEMRVTYLGAEHVQRDYKTSLEEHDKGQVS